jgi:hypothetical protein
MLRTLTPLVALVILAAACGSSTPRAGTAEAPEDAVERFLHPGRNVSTAKCTDRFSEAKLGITGEDFVGRYESDHR